jgi:Fic family protein
MKFPTNLTPTHKKEIWNRLRIEWTYHSNAIEGNTLSLGDTKFILEEGLTVQGKSLREHNEVYGHGKAIDAIQEIISKNRLEFDDIFLLHRLIQAETTVDIFQPKGAWKKEQNGRYIDIAGKLEYKPYPKPSLIPGLMEKWLEDFNSVFQNFREENIYLHYTDIHLGFTRIHPFADGNGRLARILANLPLIKFGHIPIVIPTEKRREYIGLLSNYDLHSPELSSLNMEIIEKNTFREDLEKFFRECENHVSRIVDDYMSYIDRSI